MIKERNCSATNNISLYYLKECNYFCPGETAMEVRGRHRGTYQQYNIMKIKRGKGERAVSNLEIDWCNNQVKSTVTLLRINPNDFRKRDNLRSHSLYRKPCHFTVTVILFLAKKPRAPKGGHQLAAPLPIGTTLTDFRKKQWTVGKPVGSGGFGLIYLGKLVVVISTLGVRKQVTGEKFTISTHFTTYVQLFLSM